MASDASWPEPHADRLGQDGSDLGLARRYRWVLFMIGLPLLVLVGALAANEYHYQRAQILADMEQTSTTHALALDAIAQSAGDHVRMQEWTADYFTDGRERPSRLRPNLTARAAAEEFDGLVLKGVPAEQRSLTGTDVTLETLDGFLAQLPNKVGRFWIADDHGVVLADSSATPGKAPEGASASLPPPWTLADVAAARNQEGRPYQRASHILVARHTAHAPWTLLHLVSERDVRRMLLRHFVPYGILLLALAAAFALGLFLLQREFIDPALELVRYIQRAARDATVEEPQLPPLWTTCAKVVSRTFAAHREARRELKESETFKSAIIDNAILAVITIDVDGRIVEFNPAAQAIFGHRLDDAKGETWPTSSFRSICAQRIGAACRATATRGSCGCSADAWKCRPCEPTAPSSPSRSRSP